MDPAGLWLAAAVGCAALGLFDLFVTGFLAAVFSSRWGRRGRRVLATIRRRHPDAVAFLTGPMGGPGVTGEWLAVLADERGLRAFRATGRPAWAEPWSGLRSVTARHGVLVIDRGVDGTRSIGPKSDSGDDVRGQGLVDLAGRISQVRRSAAEPA